MYKAVKARTIQVPPTFGRGGGVSDEVIETVDIFAPY